MKFFIDTADVPTIRELAATGLVDAVTTNPSLIAKTGRKFLDVVREICDIVPGHVSAEVAATDHETMLAEGRKLAKLAKNVCVKVPLTQDGLKTCKKCFGPFCITPTVQVMKNTISASGIVVLISAVGDPPKGRPSTLNGNIPN